MEQHNSCYLPELQDGWGPLLGPIPGVAGRLVPAVIHDFFYSAGESVRGPDSSGAAPMPATCLNPRTGGDLCSVRSQGWQGRLVPAVFHDFFILRVRLCGDLTAVEQHSACYLPEPRDVQGPLLGLIVAVAGALSVSCYS